MKKMKRLASAFLSFAVALTACGLTASAEETPTAITDLSQITASGSYQLAADIETTTLMQIPEGMSVTLDLNGHTISGGKVYVLENYGTLVVNDSVGTGLLHSSGAGGVRNYGNMTVNGGAITIDKGKYQGSGIFNKPDATLVINDITINTDYYALYNDGTCTINGGEFHSTSSNRAGSGNWAYCVNNRNHMVINNAVVTGIQGGVASSNGYIEIHNGTFSTDPDDSTSFYAVYIAGEYGDVEAHIYGGTFSSPRYAGYIGNDNTGGDGGINAPAIATIYGGTFNGVQGSVYPCKNTGSLAIQGGTFNSDITAYLAASCYTQNADTGAVSAAHTFGDWTETKAATCTEKGTEKHVCSVCKAEEIRDTDALGHDWDAGKVTTPATEEAEGVRTYSCSRCDATKTEAIAKLVIDKDVVSEEGAPEVSLGGDQNLSDAVLTEEEKQQASEGVDVSIRLEVKDAAETVPEEVKKEVADNLDGFTVGQYLDLSLIKVVGDNESAVKELNKEITITIKVPESLRAGKDTDRAFAVVRTHYDEATGKYVTDVLKDLDDDDSTVTFATDKFSSYTLIYKDAETSNVPTGDSSNMAAVLVILGLSAAVVSLAVWQKKRHAAR